MPELGLYDLRNRFMSPDLGRFLQPDPIGFKGDASNLYRYAGNDWGNRVDLLGLDPMNPSAELIAAAASEVETCRQVSNSNSDGQGEGWERGSWVAQFGAEIVKRSEHNYGPMARGQPGKQFTGPQTTTGPGEDLGSAPRIFEHNHTNEVFRDKSGNEVGPKKGTLVHQADREHADDAQAPYMVTDKKGKVRDLYLPSTDPAQQKAHKDWRIDRQDRKVGPWRTIMKEPPAPQATPPPPKPTTGK